MKVRILDIPPEGRTVEFPLELSELNNRIEPSRSLGRKDSKVLGPSYEFQSPPQAKVKLELDGRTVLINGEVHAECVTPCSRCLEESKHEISVPLQIVVKPFSEGARPGDEEEDIDLAFYDGREVNCSEVVRDFLMLALPFIPVCSEECQGLCPQCGENLNTGKCGCVKEETVQGNPYFADIKLH